MRELLLGYILRGKDRHFGNAISGQLLCFDVIAKRIFVRLLSSPSKSLSSSPERPKSLLSKSSITSEVVNRVAIILDLKIGKGFLATYV